MGRAVLVSALATAGGAALAAAAPPAAPVPPAPASVTPGADPSTPAFSIGPFDSYIGAADYPREALRRGEAGRVWFRLLVDETGRGRGCTVTTSSGHPALDTAACRLILARARFRPGRDSAGRPVASLTQGVYVWRLPGWERARPAGPPLPIPAPPPPPPPAPVVPRLIVPPAPPAPPDLPTLAGPAVPPRALAPLAGLVTADDYPAAALRAGEQGQVDVRLLVAASGRPARCAILASSGSLALDSAACSLAMRRMRFSPARDARGRPVAAWDTARIVWRIEDPPEPAPTEAE